MRPLTLNSSVLRVTGVGRDGAYWAVGVGGGGGAFTCGGCDSVCLTALLWG